MKKKTEIQHYRGLYVQEHRRPYGSAHIIYHILKSSEGKWIARSSCPYHHLCRCKKNKLIALLTNDMESDSNEIIEIYRKRWEIELPFKQIKQNFPLKYFYGESANAIKIQIWVTLIANLLLMIMKRKLIRSWSFSGLATMIRITLMYYVDFYSLFNHPGKTGKRS